MNDLNPVKDALNQPYFIKMAYGDLAGFAELARDFFADTRRAMAGWGSLLEQREFSRLSEEIHRCKGGASLFGLERLAELLARLEHPEHLEREGLDLEEFEAELKAAESAVRQISG